MTCWFGNNKEAIAANPEVRRTFVFIHKPAWQRDNEQNFAAIEKTLADGPYTVFYGHPTLRVTAAGALTQLAGWGGRKNRVQLEHRLQRPVHGCERQSR